MAEEKAKLIGEVEQAQIDTWKKDPKCLGVVGIIVGGHITPGSQCGKLCTFSDVVFYDSFQRFAGAG